MRILRPLEIASASAPAFAEMALGTALGTTTGGVDTRAGVSSDKSMTESFFEPVVIPNSISM